MDIVLKNLVLKFFGPEIRLHLSEYGLNQCSATRVQSQHAGFSARARFARVLACNLLIFKNLARARRARVLSVRVLRAHAFCTQKQKKRKILQRNGKLLVSTKFRLVSFKLVKKDHTLITGAGYMT